MSECKQQLQLQTHDRDAAGITRSPASRWAANGHLSLIITTLAGDRQAITEDHHDGSQRSSRDRGRSSWSSAMMITIIDGDHDDEGRVHATVRAHDRYDRRQSSPR
jgi:hypothetical protein